jgi:hypothetical protein
LQRVLTVRRDLAVLDGIEHEEHVGEVAVMLWDDPLIGARIGLLAVRLEVDATPE